MRKETEEKVISEVKNKLTVTGLIGENYKFANLAAYLKSNYSSNE